MFKQQVRAFSNRSSDQEEGSRGDISWHFNVGRGELVTRLYGSGAVLNADRVAKAAQHAFGMVTRRRRLSDAGLAIGIQASQQQTGFNLRAGHWQGVGQASQAMATANDHRRTTFCSGLDHGAHFTQWIGDAVHRPLGQRGIAGQGAVETLRGQQTGKQAHRGA